jgi:DNA polymerase delta subunit 1
MNNIFPRSEVNELNIDDCSKELVYQITDWFIPDNDKNKQDYESSEKYSIYIYGTTENNITICSKVINFQPFFYVKPPPEWQEMDLRKFKENVSELQRRLLEDTYDNKYKGKVYTNRIINNTNKEFFEKIEIVNKKDFWGFTNNKDFRFLKIIVSSMKLYNNLKYYFQSETPFKEGFKLYESNIDPFLRFIHIKNLKPCGWIKVNNYTLDDAPDTICDYNITVDWNDINPIEINKIAPLIIASFDIECSSSHGDFPVAIKNYKKLAQDLCYLTKAGLLDEKKIADYIYNSYSGDIIIDELNKIHQLYPKKPVDSKIKDKIHTNLEGIKFILSKIKELKSSNDDEDDNEDDNDDDDFDDDSKDGEKKGKKMTSKEFNEIEEALNKRLSEFLPELEGDKIIQIGLTVHKFGSDSIIYRKIITLDTCDSIENTDVLACKTEGEVLMNFKRLLNSLNPDIIIGYNIWGFDIEYIWDRTKELHINDKFSIGLGRIRNRQVVLEEQKLASSALGENIFKLFNMDGIVSIDLFKVMQKDYKLDSYKLDNVASIYINEKKDDLKPKELFERFKGGSADRCIIAKYCIQDCALVNRLLHKLKILENNIGMGNVCLVPLSFLFRRGQGIKIFSLISNECMKKDFLIPVIKNFISDEDVEGYEGAIVLEPKEGIYLDVPIVVFDYGSLYPSSMICRNLSHDTYIIDEKYKEIDDENVEIVKVSYDLYEGKGDKKVKSGVKDCYFANYKDGRKGIIPNILEMLLNERKNTRKKIEYMSVIKKDGSVVSGFPEEDETSITIIDVDLNKKTKILKSEIKETKETYNKFECAVFDALQNAYKITANSLYGQIGARTSAIYLKDIAACTTSTGREMIMIAKNFVESNYDAEVIYGDTDSIFCKFNLKNEEGEAVFGKDSLKYGIKVGEEVEMKIKKHLPYPQKLNYEKCLYPFILFSKKRYVGNLYEKDDKKFKQKSMGIVLKRRDNANIVKKVFGGIIDIILNSQDIELSVKFLKEELRDLVDGKTDLKDLILSKTLRGYYKDPTRIAHKVLADRIALRDPGNKPAVNDRIQYIYIKNSEAKLQGDKIEIPEFIVENELEPDYLHYITNQIMKPVLQLYELCLTELNDYKEEHDYWEKIEEELMKKDMYKDDKRRGNRLQNLRLRKVQEILFDEFIDKLKEPKIKKERKKKEVVKKETKEKPKEETKEEPKEETKEELLEGSIRVVESKIRNAIICNTEIFDKNKKKLFKDDRLIGITDKKITKDKVLKKLLLDIYEKFKDNNIIKLKINYKGFIKNYNTIIAKYNELSKKQEINKTDISILKNYSEIANNEEFIKIKNNIILLE